MRLVQVFQGIWIVFSLEMVFVGKNKVILGSEVRLVRQNKGMPIDFLLKNGFCK